MGRPPADLQRPRDERPAPRLGATLLTDGHEPEKNPRPQTPLAARDFSQTRQAAPGAAQVTAGAPPQTSGNAAGRLEVLRRVKERPEDSLAPKSPETRMQEGKALLKTTHPAIGAKTGPFDGLASVAGEGRDRLLNALAPKEARAEAWKGAKEASDNAEIPKDSKTTRDTRAQQSEVEEKNLLTYQNLDNTAKESLNFMDVKLITPEGLLAWEEKYPDYRAAIAGVLDEPLGKFSAKVGGYKTLREFFAAAALNDEQMSRVALGLIKLESDGDPGCQTGKAYGLMQVTPIAAEEVGLAHDSTLLTAEPNIRAGLRYLARSTHLASGGKDYDIARGVAGYVSGPAAARDKIPAGQVTTREVLTIMILLGRAEELRGRLAHPQGDLLLDYSLAAPEKREEFKRLLRNK